VSRSRIVFLLMALLGVVVISGYGIHCQLGSNALNAWGTWLTGCATLIVSGTAIFAGIQGLQEYRAKLAADKAKWLFQLYEKLFENGQYKSVRRKLDYDDTSELKALIDKDKNNQEFEPAERVTFDEFTDYLNFFEMIAHLKEAHQLTSADVRATFDYYLRLFTRRRNPEIREYLKKEGFESLDKLLFEYEP
jgi:hypothetical protein